MQQMIQMMKIFKLQVQKTINEEDSKFVEGEKVDYTPQTIEESEEEKRENEKLEDTIETDLFNLIDSMYKDDEDTGSDD